jgi:phage shock protein C
MCPHRHSAHHGPHSDAGGGAPGAGPRAPRPSGLYRNTERGKLFGVCAGLADYFGISPFVVRIAVVVAFFMFPPPTLICYLLAALLLSRAPARLYESDAEKEFWRQVRVKPSESLSRLRHRYREQEQRLRNMEAFVTSSEAKLHRAFRDLES